MAKKVTKKQLSDAVKKVQTAQQELKALAGERLKSDLGFGLGDVVETKDGKKIRVSLSRILIEDGIENMFLKGFIVKGDGTKSSKARVIRDPENWKKSE